MNVAERVAYVSHRLTTHLHDIGAVPVTFSRAEWVTAAPPDPSNLHRAYGWVAPHISADNHPAGCVCSACLASVEVETILMPFSAELIVEQSQFLDEEQFEAYIDTIEWSVSMHITNRDLPWQEREALIDKALFDVAADSMAFQNETMMRILEDEPSG